MNQRHRGIGMTSQRTRDRMIQRLKEMGISNLDVLNVIRNTPRHIFVDEALASRAYELTALPIGYGQTLSQPYMVARMTETLLRDGPLKRVLEIGTGSGYQTAILAQLIKEVYTIERIAALIPQARQRFRDLKLYNVHVRHSDGILGWPNNGFYDGIIATAAPEGIPQALLAQLTLGGGRLIIPVGEAKDQNLVLIIRTVSDYVQEVLDKVSFVAMHAGMQ